ncbi:MAG: hypothetical protein GX916_02365 [Clostridiales bacterium]|nr:hypothetical protein [Clostridiales bacterium]
MPSQRVISLREEALCNTASALASDEMRYLYLRGWADHAGEWLLPRRHALARAAVLRGMTPVIGEGELIVGRQNFDRQLNDEEKAFLDAAGKLVPYRVGQDSHMAVDYEKLLHQGTEGVREEIAGYMSALDTLTRPGDVKKRVFYENCLILLDALDALAANYAIHARALAAREADPVRRQELQQIANNLDRVPRYPARTFYEALQAVQMYTFHLEGLYQAGRPDQYLLPFYEQDIQSGRLTRADALELIDCFCLMYTRTVPKGLAVGLMVGGRSPDGGQVNNELTRLFLESILHTRLAYPGVGLCVTRETPDDILRLALKALGQGCTNPALFGDEVIVEGLMQLGIPFEEATQYIHSTCVEITPIKRSGVWVASPYHNLMAPLLDIMHSGDHQDIADFDTLMVRYRERLVKAVQEGLEHQNLMMYNRTLYDNHPLVSCFVDDCLARGLALDNGGARYAYMTPSFVGMANLVDSLIAIRRLVFQERQVTLAEFAKVLENNYVGDEPLRAYIMNRLPRYGNDNEEADTLAQEITAFLPEIVRPLRTYNGEPLAPSMFCWIMHEHLGRDTGATPDGRLAGFPLGDGSGPAQGRETCGPTASILSSTSWDHTPFTGGIAVNLKLAAAFFEEDVLEDTLQLVRVFFERGGFELQINVVNRQTLLDAQKNPDAHRDLVVRIGGYSDFFTNLSPQMQAEVLLRTEHVV